MPISDILIILRVYLISLGLQLVSLPLTRKLFSGLPDYGYPLSRLITTLLTSLVVWEVSNLGLPANTNLGLWISAAILVSTNIAIILKNGLKTFRITKEALKMIVVEEYLFFVGLAGIAFVRGFQPNIDSLEKFMDFGFVNRYLLSPTLPAMDMWQAGKSINYYSFGHFWSSSLIRYFGVIPTVGYNMVLAFLAGLCLSISFSISYHLTGAKKGIAGMIGGLIGAFAVVLAGNTHAVWYFISHRGLTGYWYAEATRFIHNTIHEFPGYSFVVADLHGHLIGLPMVLAFITVFLHWLKSKKIADEIIMGILFGLMMMTNTWDVPIYGLLLTVTGLLLLRAQQTNIFGLIKTAGVMLLFMLITALPWFISFQSISSGIRLVTERSPLWQLAVLWFGGLTVSVVAVLTEKKHDQKIPIIALAVTILLLILIPEFVFAKDIYPDHPRANTMFKLTYQASVMIGLLLGGLMGKLFDYERKLFWWWRWLSVVLVGAIFVGTMIFPVESFPNFYVNFETYRGLDGEDWLRLKMPERYNLIKYLRENRDGKNMAEAVGDSYTEFNAISVFSGIPTIQGWRVHEWLWRGGYDAVATRENEVRNIYESNNLTNTVKILKRYNVGWIVVGSDERNTYKINMNGLLQLGEVVWRDGETSLIKVSETNDD